MADWTIVMREDTRYDEKDAWCTPNNQFVRLHSRYQRATLRWSVHLIGPNGECRREHGGPVVPGPYAFLVPQATVISAHRERPSISVEVQAGDVLTLECFDFSKKGETPVRSHTLRFRIEDDKPHQDPILVLV